MDTRSEGARPVPALCPGHAPGGYHLGVELSAHLKSISHRCLFFEMAFVWELTEETIHLPLGCLQGGARRVQAR